MPDTGALDPRHAPVSMTAEQFRSAGYRLVDRVAGLLDTISQRPVTPAESPLEIRALLGATDPLPQHGSDPAILLERAADLLLEHSLLNGHPRFLGYITSSPAPIGALADLLAAAVNPNVGPWLLSPMASEIEAQTIRWIAELVGYPTSSGGLFVSGGNMANLVCFLAARQAKSRHDLRARGVGNSRLRAYCSRETHTWIQKAADLSGLGTDSIRWIATNADLTLNLDALRDHIEEDLAAGDQPFLVIGTAGTVSTGAVDALDQLAAIAQEFDLWFHIDGAYGGFAAILPDAPSAFSAIPNADSIAVDPHKWLYAPLEAGCALVRNPEHLRDAFAYHPPYYHFGVEAVNFFDLGPQNSRGFRALKVWLALQQVGREGYVQLLADDVRLAQELFRLAGQHAELEPLTQSLSITTFRYVPADLQRAAHTAQAYLNQLNTDLLTELQRGGQAYLSNAVIHGCFALRACFVNFRTTLSDVEALPPHVAAIGQRLDAQHRPGRTA